jgi:hypothetical protein
VAWAAASAAVSREAAEAAASVRGEAHMGVSSSCAAATDGPGFMLKRVGSDMGRTV